MINLLQDVWEKEELATEWKTLIAGYIVKILKKGDPSLIEALYKL